MTSTAGSTPASPTAGAPLLVVDNLSVAFSTREGWLQAVRNVSVTLEAGKTLGVVGESGSGKSVFSRALMRLLPTTARIDPASKVWFDGDEISAMTPAEARQYWGPRISMVFQDPMSALTPVVRIGRQITEPLRFHLGLSRDEAKKEAIRLLEQVSIPEPERRLRQYPHELSGGMRQRVLIAIAIGCSPSLLIADEPTTALDVTVQAQILALLRRLRDERGMAAIFISHDLGVVAGQADTIAVMYAGQVVELAPTKRLFRRIRHPYTAGLFASIPRLSDSSHTRLAPIPGRMPSVVDIVPGCPFAPRCPNAQAKCLVENPPLVADESPDHRYACFYPVGTPAGDGAYAANISEGHNAAGRPLVTLSTPADPGAR